MVSGIENPVGQGCKKYFDLNDTCAFYPGLPGLEEQVQTEIRGEKDSRRVGLHREPTILYRVRARIVHEEYVLAAVTDTGPIRPTALQDHR